MHIIGKFEGAYITTDGDVLISFTTKDKEKAMSELDAIKDIDKLSIDAIKYKEKKSNQANAYMWQLLDKIAKHPEVKSDKWDVYLAHIKLDGVFVDVRIKADLLEMLKRQYRYVEVLGESIEADIYGNETVYIDVRCYYGSSCYSKSELSTLINSVVDTAKIYGIDTWTNDEIKEALSVWEGNRADGNKY